MKLGLSTIAGLGADGDSKSAVLSALFSTTDRHSVLGTYGFDKNGDTTLRSYGLYKVSRSGDLTFVRTITPPRVLDRRRGARRRGCAPPLRYGAQQALVGRLEQVGGRRAVVREQRRAGALAQRVDARHHPRHGALDATERGRLAPASSVSAR